MSKSFGLHLNKTWDVDNAIKKSKWTFPPNELRVPIKVCAHDFVLLID